MLTMKVSPPPPQAQDLSSMEIPHLDEEDLPYGSEMEHSEDTFAGSASEVQTKSQSSVGEVSPFGEEVIYGAESAHGRGYLPLSDDGDSRSGTSSRKGKASLSHIILKKFKKKDHKRSSTKCSDQETHRIQWEEEQSRLLDVWLNDLLPSWDKRKSGSKVRSLCFKGIPAQVRGRVWMSALGNEMKVTEDLYQILRDQAEHSRSLYHREKEDLENADGDLGGVGGRAEELLLGEISAHKMIMLDLSRTYPELGIFRNEKSPYRQHLHEVLEAFVCFRPEVGYSQGMSFVVALLLLNMEPTDAFVCFVNMISKSCFLDFYTMKMPEVKVYMMVHQKFFKEELPSLYNHFQRLQIEPEMYVVKWIMCLFCQSLPLEATSRIWDIYFLDGDVTIFRAAIGVLRFLQPSLLKMNFEDVAYLLSHIPDDINEDEVIRSIRSVQIVTPRRLKELVKDCKEQIKKRRGDSIERATSPGAEKANC